jgi:thiol-disulfide isomerase/thioredoxin
MSQPPAVAAPPAAPRPARWLIPVIAVAVAAVVGYAVYEAQQELPVPGVELVDATFATLDQAVAANKGKVVVVDFWATWCGPCRATFPHVVEMHHRYADRGAAFISVSFEHDPAEDRVQAYNFLKRNRATFTNFLWTDRTQAGYRGLHERFGYPDAIPYAAVFGRDGKRIPPPDGERFSPRELVDAIEGELDKNAAAK